MLAVQVRPLRFTTQTAIIMDKTANFETNKMRCFYTTLTAINNYFSLDKMKKQGLGKVKQNGIFRSNKK